MTFATSAEIPACQYEDFLNVRQQSEELCAPLSPEDMMVQSCAEASPAKWHLAHTTWFFETFLLSVYLPGYKPFDPNFRWLFNSYYNSVSDQPEKKLRSSFSRPPLDAILAYRHYVAEGMEKLLAGNPPDEVARRVILGMHHEQQHQELLAYDIKHAFWTNPLRPAYIHDNRAVCGGASVPPEWVGFEGGLFDVGHTGNGFSFDNELPRHPEYLRPFVLASRLVTCAEYLEFISDRAYERPELWLSAGWEAVQAESWKAPLYWRQRHGEWLVYTLHGEKPLSEMLQTPVCHVSYFEADAFAHWAQKRLPTEAEWEIAAQDLPVNGNFIEGGVFHPQPVPGERGPGLTQMFGDVWEWTSSPYIGYPGFQAIPGALGEYNGKFMSNQMVLRGGSAVTPSSHIRATYRNFFSPATRWQFSGIRLAAL